MFLILRHTKAIHDFRYRASICLAVVALALDRFSMKKLLAIFAAFWVFFYSDLSLAQVTTPYGGWVDGVTSTGQRQWYGPGNLTKSSATVGNAVWTAATTTGAKVTTSAELAFGAAKVPVVLKGIATASAIIGTAKVILGGPVGVGMTALMLAPALVDWFTTDTTHPGPSSTWATDKPFEMVKTGTCSSGTCYEYSFSGQTAPRYSSPSAACSTLNSDIYSSSSPVFEGGSWVCRGYSRYQPDNYQMLGSLTTYEIPPTPAEWVPASIDDIRARMEMEPYVLGVVEGVLNAGGSLPIAYAPSDGWSGATGPASLSAVPVVKSTVVSPLALGGSVGTVGGNPFNLAGNTPTVTSTVNGSRDVMVDGKNYSIPTKTITTSTYDPSELAPV